MEEHGFGRFFQPDLTPVSQQFLAILQSMKMKRIRAAAEDPDPRRALRVGLSLRSSVLLRAGDSEWD